MSLSESFALISFTLFSFADLRYRLVPGIEVFFIGSALLAMATSPWQAGLIALACAWGVWRDLPGPASLPLLFYPPAWPVLLAGYGYRRGLVGRADLLAIAGIACLFPLAATLLALLGLEIWRRLWVRHQGGPIPALPGLLLGIVIYFLSRLFLPYSIG
jgi:hypothetical protein